MLVCSLAATLAQSRQDQTSRYQKLPSIALKVSECWFQAEKQTLHSCSSNVGTEHGYERKSMLCAWPGHRHGQGKLNCHERKHSGAGRQAHCRGVHEPWMRSRARGTLPAQVMQFWSAECAWSMSTNHLRNNLGSRIQRPTAFSRGQKHTMSQLCNRVDLQSFE